MSSPDAPGAVDLTTAAPPLAPAPAGGTRLVPGALVAGLGALVLFTLPPLAAGPGVWILTIAAGIALVVAGALIAARPGAHRALAVGVGVGTLVVQFVLGRTWHTAPFDLVIVGLLCLGLGLTWFAGRRSMRLWWTAALPPLVLAAGLVVNAVLPRRHDSNWYWRDWHSRPLLHVTVLLVGVALALVAVIAERRGPDPVRQAPDPSRADRFAAGQAQAAAAAQAAQVAQIQQWQAAWAAANPGQPASAAPAPPLALALPVAPGDRTNTMAVLALVFGLLGAGIVPVVLGHISLGQINRTGERGRGMAIGGLVLGYLGLAVLAAVVVTALANS